MPHDWTKPPKTYGRLWVCSRCGSMLVSTDKPDADRKASYGNKLVGHHYYTCEEAVVVKVSES